MTDSSACDPAPTRCLCSRAQRWKRSTASTAAGAGRAGRQGGSWTTHWPADLHRDAATGTTLSHTVETSALSCLSHTPCGEWGAESHGKSMQYTPAFLHHKSQLPCTKTCWVPLPVKKKNIDCYLQPR